uniref:Uncharacterized protein n=1 Tax=Rhizophora mucronata TaxID=61149 RepID=A0A2P2Q561_RHIMU
MQNLFLSLSSHYFHPPHLCAREPENTTMELFS